MAAITEGANGFPGANGRIPLECATMPQILQDNGWSTFWLGKDHNVPEQDIASGATRKQWPLQQGFDRFYGFLGGETNQWYPDLVDDNKFIDQPYSPEEGYHLSRDLADQALHMIRDHTPPTRRGRGTCGSARAPTMRRTIARRPTSTSTRASSTTATKRIGRRCFRG